MNINKVKADYFGGKPVVLWRGPSNLGDGREAVLVVKFSSRNSKTGPVHQAAIFDPGEADPVTGHVGAGCRLCPAARACYPFQAYMRWNHEDNHGRLDDLPVIPRQFWPEFIFNGVRWGEYGDPAALEFPVVDEISRLAAGHFGYSHFWRVVGSEFSRYLMASCESLDDVQQARALGWRSYLVVKCGTPKSDKSAVLRSVKTWARAADTGLVVCPHYVNGVQCSSCADSVKCSGTSAGARVDVVAWSHGSRASSHPGQVVPLLPILA